LAVFHDLISSPYDLAKEWRYEGAVMRLAESIQDLESPREFQRSRLVHDDNRVSVADVTQTGSGETIAESSHWNIQLEDF
jgi:hypothetical protein